MSKSELKGANAEFSGDFGPLSSGGEVYLQKKTAMAVPHLFRKKPHSRQLSQTNSYCLQTRVPRFTRVGSSIGCWSNGRGLHISRSPPS
jgi:hypothetical protein